MAEAPLRDRYRTVAARFTEVVEGVPADGWERPAPPEGWVARDVVRHLVEWVPAFMAGGGGPALAVATSVDDDPARAWHELDDAIAAVLADPAAETTYIEHPRAGRHRLDEAIGMFFLGDVFLHTWDLARATGQDEALDPDIAAGMLAGMEPLDEVLRQSGQYGPRVEVPADADITTRLVAFTGRRP